jgi:hypothetical protein
MTVAEIANELYGLPPAEFTRARDEVAKELRSAGRREEAEQVKALRRPTAAAAAVNRLVREHNDEVREFLRAAAALHGAQFAGKGDLEAATRDEREARERLIQAGGEGVRRSLMAAAVDEAAAKELLEGRLDRELEPRGFDALLAGTRLRAPPKLRATATKPRSAARKAPAAAEPARREPKTPDDRAARARLREAKAALSTAEAGERQAQRRWEQARREREAADAAVEKAQRDLDRLHGR